MVVGADAGTHILVAKSRDDIEKIWPAALGALGRGALSLLGRGGAKAAAGKGAQVGVKGAAGTTGATGAGAITPAAGATTTALQPASATAGTSMASSSSAQGATQAAPVKVQPSQPAQGGNIFDDAVRESQMGDLSSTDSGPSWEKGQETFDNYVTSGSDSTRGNVSPAGTQYSHPPLKNENPTPTTENTSQPTLDEVAEPIEAEQAADAKRVEDAKTKRSARNTKVVAYGYPAAQMAMGMRGNAQAKQQAEMERIERLAQDGKANSTTGGGKVAVTA